MRSYDSIVCLSCFFSGFLSSIFFLSLGLSFIFENTAVRQDDTFSIFVKLYNLERKFLFQLSLSSVLFYQVFGSSESFNTIRQSNYSTLIEHFDDSTFMDRIDGKDTFEYVPRILFELFVTQAQTTIFLVDFQYLNFDVGSDLSKFRRVFDFLRPRKV